MKRTLPPIDENEAGFTLVELLVSLVLLSLLSLCLYGALAFAMKALQRVDSQSRGQDAITRAKQDLREELEAAFPLFLAKADLPHIDFDGTVRRMAFLSPAGLSVGGPGNARVVVTDETDRGDIQLVLMAVPELSPDSKPVREVLVRHVHDVKFSYYGRTANETDATWHSEWIAQPRLPDLIRLTMSFDVGDERHWPDLIVWPRIAADATCLYDALTHYCRGR